MELTEARPAARRPAVRRRRRACCRSSPTPWSGAGSARSWPAARAALAAGHGRPELSMSVKGLELPAFDPRGMTGQGLAFATSNRGGCHTRANMLGHEIIGVPERLDRFATARQGAAGDRPAGPQRRARLARGLQVRGVRRDAGLVRAPARRHAAASRSGRTSSCAPGSASGTRSGSSTCAPASRAPTTRCRRGCCTSRWPRGRAPATWSTSSRCSRSTTAAGAGTTAASHRRKLAELSLSSDGLSPREVVAVAVPAVEPRTS